jgi:hypothetical protein
MGGTASVAAPGGNGYAQQAAAAYRKTAWLR